MAVEFLGTGNDDGVVFGRYPEDKIGFYGKAPIVRPASIFDATDAGSTTTRVNAVLAQLRLLGLIGPAASE